MQDQTLAQLRRPVAGRVMFASVLGAVSTALSVVPMVAVVEIGRRLLALPPQPVWPLAWWATGLLLARAILGPLAGWLGHSADVELGDLLRRQLADHLAVLPLGWYRGGVSARVRATVQDDVAALHHAVAHAWPDLAAAITGPLVIAAYLLAVDWRLGLLTIAAVAGAQLIRVRLAARAADRSALLNRARVELSSASLEMVAGIAVIKAFGTGGAPPRFRAAARSFCDVADDIDRSYTRQRAMTRASVSPTSMLLLVAVAGTALVTTAGADPVDLTAFVLLAPGLFDLLTPFYAARDRERAAHTAGRQVAGLLAEPVEELPPEPVALPAGPLEVRCENLGFGYTPERQVLHSVDAVLRPGTMTALVGASGAGKSTLALLLARFYQPTEGSIRLAGVDLRDVAPSDLYRHVGFLFQDVTLLRATIRENISLADPDAGEAAVHAAATAANIHDRILRLPSGYDTVVGRDVKLSGGEAQRVAIARTLLADTPVLILDEATASADPESEAEVQDALARLATGRTVLVVAHRLRTVVGADQILVLDEGTVVQRGRHEELLAGGGIYARLWHAQNSPDPGFSRTEERA